MQGESRWIIWHADLCPHPYCLLRLSEVAAGDLWLQEKKHFLHDQLWQRRRGGDWHNIMHACTFTYTSTGVLLLSKWNQICLLIFSSTKPVPRVNTSPLHHLSLNHFPPFHPFIITSPSITLPLSIPPSSPLPQSLSPFPSLLHHLSLNHSPPFHPSFITSPSITLPLSIPPHSNKYWPLDSGDSPVCFASSLGKDGSLGIISTCVGNTAGRDAVAFGYEG